MYFSLKFIDYRRLPSYMNIFWLSQITVQYLISEVCLLFKDLDWIRMHLKSEFFKTTKSTLCYKSTASFILCCWQVASYRLKYMVLHNGREISKYLKVGKEDHKWNNMGFCFTGWHLKFVFVFCTKRFATSFVGANFRLF